MWFRVPLNVEFISHFGYPAFLWSLVTWYLSLATANNSSKLFQFFSSLHTGWCVKANIRLGWNGSVSVTTRSISHLDSPDKQISQHSTLPHTSGAMVARQHEGYLLLYIWASWYRWVPCDLSGISRFWKLNLKMEHLSWTIRRLCWMAGFRDVKIVRSC